MHPGMREVADPGNGGLIPLTGGFECCAIAPAVNGETRRLPENCVPGSMVFLQNTIPARAVTINGAVGVDGSPLVLSSGTYPMILLVFGKTAFGLKWAQAN